MAQPAQRTLDTGTRPIRHAVCFCLFLLHAVPRPAPSYPVPS